MTYSTEVNYSDDIDIKSEWYFLYPIPGYSLECNSCITLPFKDMKEVKISYLIPSYRHTHTYIYTLYAHTFI